MNTEQCPVCKHTEIRHYYEGYINEKDTHVECKVCGIAFKEKRMNEAYKQKCQKCGAPYTIDGVPQWQLGLCVQLMRTHPDFFSAINKDKRDFFMDGVKTALEHIVIEYEAEQIRTINAVTEQAYALGVPISISLSKEKQREVL